MASFENDLCLDCCDVKSYKLQDLINKIVQKANKQTNK